jgi:large subunit ribosomal protein L23
MSMSLETVIRPVVTEKSAAQYGADKTYTFRVATKASKTAIREAIQGMFGVTVVSVRTINVRAKERRPGGLGRGRGGIRSPWKKAIVTLKDGDVIPIFEG